MFSQFPYSQTLRHDNDMIDLCVSVHYIRVDPWTVPDPRHRGSAGSGAFLPTIADHNPKHWTNIPGNVTCKVIQIRGPLHFLHDISSQACDPQFGTSPVSPIPVPTSPDQVTLFTLDLPPNFLVFPAQRVAEARPHIGAVPHRWTQAGSEGVGDPSSYKQCTVLIHDLSCT